MYRTIETDLKLWQHSPHRKPLILRGARQVGKTTAIRQFAEDAFTSLVEVNFELQPELKRVFETPDARTIVQTLALLLKKPIDKPHTLLFLDEIQACPHAITALRYFHELLPDLAVIAAGSLLEFALESEIVHMPVGRIEFLHLYPLTFTEFLHAMGETALVDFLHTVSLHNPIPDTVHDKLLALFRHYTVIGGMPEVVLTYRDNPSSPRFQDLQRALLQTYRNDFGKYASRAKHPYLEKVFGALPEQVGHIYKYSQVDRAVQSRDLKAALGLILKAGLATQITAVSGHGLPLTKSLNDKRFKVLFMDVGLMQRHFGLDAEIALTPDFLSMRAGAIAEQAVGQDLLALRSARETPDLFFWYRDQKNSQAEIDYVTALRGHVIPIEVKAGKTGTLKSLNLFLKENPAPFGIRFSELPLSFHDRILSLPLYMVREMPAIVETLLLKT